MLLRRMRKMRKLRLESDPAGVRSKGKRGEKPIVNEISVQSMDAAKIRLKNSQRIIRLLSRKVECLLPLMLPTQPLLPWKSEDCQVNPRRTRASTRRKRSSHRDISIPSITFQDGNKQIDLTLWHSLKDDRRQQ